LKSKSRTTKNVIDFSAEVSIFKITDGQEIYENYKNCIKRATLLTAGNFVEKEALPAEFFKVQTSL
jgi:two-component system response regulator HydG